MAISPDEPRKEQQLLRHARREGLLVMAVWAVALAWTTIGSLFMGYGRDANDIRLVVGIPDWIFWNVVIPWGLSVAFSVWFCFGYMADDDLGEDAEGPGDV